MVQKHLDHGKTAAAQRTAVLPGFAAASLFKDKDRYAPFYLFQKTDAAHCREIFVALWLLGGC